jgi:hypothetical protein
MEPVECEESSLIAVPAGTDSDADSIAAVGASGGWSAASGTAGMSRAPPTAETSAIAVPLMSPP